MARQRDPRREKAFEIFREKKGEITNRAIAELLSLPEKTIGGWKSKDKWLERLSQKANGVLQSDGRSIPKNTEYSKKKKSRPKGKFPPPSETSMEKAEDVDLPPKQQLFVHEYLVDFNATQAAIRAGYTANSARITASKLLAKANVRKAVAQLIPGLRQRMSEDSRIAYLALWNQLHEIDRQLADHDEAQEKVRELKEDYMDAVIKEQEEKVLRLRLEIGLYTDRIMRHGNWVKAQELRRTILQDILDRGGYKQLDLLADDPDKLQLARNKDRREEEKLQIEREKLALERSKIEEREDDEVDGLDSLAKAIEQSNKMFGGEE
ncbi:terminase small subunit [Aneurinibacillus sp. Ricciae_BoGa-3]|uniref:terminase small subunit n=1 Tax=Aneurinibacillus sp. Ricciae_BoGa-3 TaxID=3022697 RepID=UPI00234218B9|nr:terminase small subunit [Aneurinibacillus sp. Ricciae_BoGa-3]WCK55419.1 terminase small subunit [Aneurinibacillus sp. Ricciae_BoGa-3]